MNASQRLRLSRAHRLLGLAALVPLCGWIASSFVLHAVGLAAPNGLQGVYELPGYHREDVDLDDPTLLGPSDILGLLAADGVSRVYWLRLEQLAGRAAYVAKPGPFDLERLYDARTGERLDPLADEMVRAIGDDALVGSRVVSMHPEDAFNRYYTLDRVPGVALQMEGDQPSEVVISRTGRTLRRTDPLAAAFEKAYRSVHVWQWGDALRLFTGLLYALVGITLVLVILGYTLWFDRRAARARWSDQVRPARRLHARFALVAGLVLATQMLVGAYLWFNLGLIEPRFRGQGSFAQDWQGGIQVDESLPQASEVALMLPGDAAPDPRPIQRFEWRGIGDERYWLAYPTRTGPAVLVSGATGDVLPRLTPAQGARAGAMVVLGEAVGPGEASTEYWMDFNLRVPTYRYRFSDPDDPDIHISQMTGEVVQRRPGIWRAFGPFLAYHTFGFTGNPWLDTVLLTLMQALVLVMMVSGLRLARGRAKGGSKGEAKPAVDSPLA